LCCQYFAGKQTISARHKEAIEATKGMILTYQDRPILALFSSCAGGHTESYQNCFSDPKTNQFPPDPLPYLTGVPEGKLPCPMSEGEKALKALWHQAKPDTADAWSPHFKWKVDMSADAIEAHMHHVVETMMNDKDKAPFIVPPSSAKFGHVEGFEVAKRGVSGTAIELHIKTRSGIWTIKKELVIRDVFRNDETRLKRLKSAKIFFAHYKDRLGLLSNLTIYGLGWGHGVGLQQTGSQGFAKRGLKANQILQHYFPGAVPENSSS